MRRTNNILGGLRGVAASAPFVGPLFGGNQSNHTGRRTKSRSNSDSSMDRSLDGTEQQRETLKSGESTRVEQHQISVRINDASGHDRNTTEATPGSEAASPPLRSNTEPIGFGGRARSFFRRNVQDVDVDKISESIGPPNTTSFKGGLNQVHQEVQLVIRTDAFVLYAPTTEQPKMVDCLTGSHQHWDVVTISFETGQITHEITCEIPMGLRQFSVFGCIGQVKLHAGVHLLVVTERRRVGKLMDADVYSIQKIAVLPPNSQQALQILSKLCATRTTSVMMVQEETPDSSSDSDEVDYTSDGGVDGFDEEGDAGLSMSPFGMVTRMRSVLVDLVRRKPSLNSLQMMSDDEPEDTNRLAVGIEPLRSRSETALPMKSNPMLTSPVVAPTTATSTVTATATTIGNEPNQRVSPKLRAHQKSNTEITIEHVDVVSDSEQVLLPSSITSALRAFRRGRNGTRVTVQDEKEVLDRRVIRELVSLLSGGSFYMSYSLEITRSLQQLAQESREEKESKPLWQRTDKRFWWNEAAMQPWIEKELHAWILPIMQGYMHIQKCTVEERTFDFVLISRRSCERAGMRYERRGVNKHGDVANFVETEQALFLDRENETHFVSFQQTRGSIPLYWSQSPYRLRPTPIIELTESENAEACRLHFDKQLERYGPQLCVNLVELQGREAILGSLFRRHVRQLEDPRISYVEFDFHHECRGMKYENLSKLIQEIEQKLTNIGYFWSTSKDNVLCQQTGIVRTNCMDCLDRTNVVQSAIARYVLNLQLLRLGIQYFPERGIANYEAFETVFNHAWANNGDSISREYAGTSALKGDFTRTGKRNLQGMMNDATNSLTRLYQNAFRDYFRQATIDFFLGKHTIDTFKRVLANTNRVQQPEDKARWMKIRANAVEVSSSIVVGEGEMLLNGWTLLSPVTPHTLRDKLYEEKVVLLTQLALYVCTFHYALEKVVEFVRISLDTITKVQHGEYILSVARPEHTDPKDNYGFVVHYKVEGEATRFNSGSMRNYRKSIVNILGPSTSLRPDPTRFFAFKAIPVGIVDAENLRFGTAIHVPDEQNQRCIDIIASIVTEITVACAHIGNEGSSETNALVVDQPIISLEEALNNTSLVSKVGNRLKKVVLN